MQSVIILTLTCFILLHPQPPLPEEDYPQDEDAEEPEELLATGPPTLPKEYMLSHASRPIIPRATLDRSTPAGWTLSVDANGAWVFTSEHSPEQVAATTEWKKENVVKYKKSSFRTFNLV